LDGGDELGEVGLESVEDLGGVLLGAQADLPLPGPGVIDDLLRRTLGLANEPMPQTSWFWRSRASSRVRSASRLASASISSRSLTIQRACLISSGIVDRIWSRRS
jgi:hypothetical protein